MIRWKYFLRWTERKVLNIAHEILHTIKGHVNDCEAHHTCGDWIIAEDDINISGFPMQVWTLYNTYTSTRREWFQASEKGPVEDFE